MGEKPHEPTIIDAVAISPGISALARWRALRQGAATFARLSDAPRDRRGDLRRKARLRSGKALDERDRFLCDCVIADRSADGACVRLARNVALPQKFRLYDDVAEALFAATVVWRRGADIGCRLSPAPGKAQVVRRMRAPYYAL